MTQEENKKRFLSLVEAVTRLYTKEGRSKSYISELLGIDRWYLTKAIKEYNIREPETKRRLNKSVEKFLNRNRDRILKMISDDMSVSQIANEFGKTRDQINRIIQIDEVLKQAETDKVDRMHERHTERVQCLIDKSSRNYKIIPIDGEIWKQVPGYNGYEVSNLGRVKRYAKRYNTYFLIAPQPNKKNGRLYISMNQENGKRKNLMLARVVASLFCDGKSDMQNTVNHIDGDILNNCAANLEWVSQASNNLHSYQELHRPVNIGKPIDYTIRYLGKYEFKTIAAFARFIDKSWTQARRYLDESEKYGIEKVYC